MKIRTYSELIKLNTFEDRFNYLRLDGNVGFDTFGFERFINQNFYKSRNWRDIRNKIILRDEACDLGLPGYEINSRVIIHHMNPLRVDDIVDMTDYVMNPEYLICVTHDTHNAIHYGTEPNRKELVIRTSNDTCPWRK